MKTNRLSDKITTALNEQMTKEAHASQIYLSYGAWADNNIQRHRKFSFPSCSRGTKPYDENTGIHIKQRCKAIVAIAPTTDPVSVNNCFEKI
jgi:ferritin